MAHPPRHPVPPLDAAAALQTLMLTEHRLLLADGNNYPDSLEGAYMDALFAQSLHAPGRLVFTAMLGEGADPRPSLHGPPLTAAAVLMAGAIGGGPPSWLDTTEPPPRALSTAAFPDPGTRAADNRQSRSLAGSSMAAQAATTTKKRRRGPPAGEACCVCLDPLLGGGPTPRRPLELPACGHHLHRRCLFGLLVGNSLGAEAMVRCPLCRATVDRHDCTQMGLDVRPSALCAAARRCAAVRRLADGAVQWRDGEPAASRRPATDIVADLVGQCAGTRASDGFVYNCSVLCLDRALYHRRGLVLSLATEIRLSRPKGG